MPPKNTPPRKTAKTLKPPPVTADSLLGAPARAFLESQGYVARTPTIRSRDFDLVNTCLFAYYLQRRLGLVPAFSVTVSDALSKGSWFHVALEHAGKPWPEVAAGVALRLRQRIDEIKKAAVVFRLGVEETTRIIDRTKEDADTTLAWLIASSAYRAPQGELKDGWLNLFTQPHWVNLGHEVAMHAPIPNHLPHKRIDIDILYHNTRTNDLWILDAKTTGLPPWLRAQTLRVEAAPLHYLSVLDYNLTSGLLFEAYPNLPRNVKLGGFMHLVLGKPSIRFCDRDRDSGLLSESKRNGRAIAMPLKNGQWECRFWTDPTGEGEPTQVATVATRQIAEAQLTAFTQVQVKPSYFGEPKLSNYIARCREWYTSTGEYSDNADEFAVRPPVLLSTIRATFLRDPVALYHYDLQLKRVLEFAEQRPDPIDFDPTADGMTSFNDLSVYAPFYTSPVRDWPNIIKTHRFLQDWFED